MRRESCSVSARPERSPSSSSARASSCSGALHRRRRGLGERQDLRELRDEPLEAERSRLHAREQHRERLLEPRTDVHLLAHGLERLLDLLVDVGVGRRSVQRAAGGAGPPPPAGRGRRARRRAACSWPGRRVGAGPRASYRTARRSSGSARTRCPPARSRRGRGRTRRPASHGRASCCSGDCASTGRSGRSSGPRRPPPSAEPIAAFTPRTAAPTPAAARTGTPTAHAVPPTSAPRM